MFEYKTDAQLEAMTNAERDSYAAAKRKHEAEMAEKTISDKVDTAKKELQTELDAAKKANENLEAVVKKQGEVLADLKDSPATSTSVQAKALKAELEEIQKKSVNGLQAEKVKIKAFTGDNVIAMGDVPNVAGTGVIAGAVAGIRQFFAQIIPGIFVKPIPTSNILDYCDVQPLEGNQLVAISETSTLNIAITPEGGVKPVSNATWAVDVENANPAATIWKSTDQMRRWFSVFLLSFYRTVIRMFDRVIPYAVMDKVRAQAAPFTPVSVQKVANPNNFDAIIQMIASIKHLGYTPNCVRISDFAYANLKTMKATDGHYMLSNGGSIQLLDGKIDFGTIKVPIETDSLLGDDDVIVGDFNSVKVGLDNELDYVEAYVGNDLETNKKSHRLEKYVAVIIPTALRSGIIKDTFTNVKALISA